MSSEVETSLNVSETARDSSTSVGMTKKGPTRIAKKVVKNGKNRLRRQPICLIDGALYAENQSPRPLFDCHLCDRRPRPDGRIGKSAIHFQRRRWKNRLGRDRHQIRPQENRPTVRKNGPL